MARRQSVVNLLALAACCSLAAGQRATSHLTRRLAQAGSDDWLTAEVTNKCSRAVSFRAAYTYFDDLDGGHPCPNKLPGADGFSACSTQWQTIGPDQSVVVSQVPDMLWWYTAYAEGTDPPEFLSRQPAEAWLASADDFRQDCQEANVGDCVWWGQPEESSQRLVLECPELDGPAAGAPSPAEFPVLLVNNCSAAVEVKAAYSLPEGADASACVIDQWQGKDKRLCVTGWREVEAGGELLVGGTTDTFWAYGAHLAADPAYDLAELSAGAFQRANDTTPCPEEDAYGSGYVCEWWAPSFQSGTDPVPGPVFITCDDYDADEQ